MHAPRRGYMLGGVFGEERGKCPARLVARLTGGAAAACPAGRRRAGRAAAAAAGPYVSLGDSYTAGPLVPNPTGNPILCGRSTHNYPSDVNRTIQPSSFTDASCSSATTADMTQSQSLEGGAADGPAPVQRAQRLRRAGDGRDRRQRRRADRRRRGVRQARRGVAVRNPLQGPLQLRRQRLQRGGDQCHWAQGGRRDPGDPPARAAGRGARRRLSRRAPRQRHQLLAGRCPSPPET